MRFRRGKRETISRSPLVDAEDLGGEIYVYARCPGEGIRNTITRLTVRGVPVVLYLYGPGFAPVAADPAGGDTAE